METVEHAGRTATLVLELSSGKAILNGDEVELPLREFRFLVALAERVGETVPTAELIEAVWPGEPWTPKENLYNLATKLRRSIDGPDKFGRHIRSRRGFGYLLDMEPQEVSLVESLERRSKAHVVTLEPQEIDEIPEVPLSAAPSHHSGDQERAPLIERPRVPVLVASALAISVLLASAWAAGYRWSRDVGSHEAVTKNDDTGQSARQVPEKTSDSADGPTRNKKRKGSKTKDRERRGRASGGLVASGPSLSGHDADPSEDAPSGPSTSDTTGDKAGSPSKPAAPLPPAPTRYLYHLMHPETGDHFVTTDGSIASQYEGRGYQGGAVGGIYASAPEGVETKSITTNNGTGYIFASSSPKTEPASRTAPLYYSSDGQGDFFYTTNESEANRAGWSGSLVGYVRAL